MEIISRTTMPRSGRRITMDDTVICRTAPSRRSLNTAKSFDRQYCNTLPANIKTSPSSSPLMRRSESTKYGDGLFRGRFAKLTRRNIVMRNQQPMRSSSFDTEGEPSSHPLSHRIKSRRGAVTSDLSPASSEASVEECHDHHDPSVCSAKVADQVTTSAPCSPQMTLKPRMQEAGQDTTNHSHYVAGSEVGPTLASVAAVHLQDFIEASAQGLSRDSTSEQLDNKKKFGSVLRKSISAKIKRTLGKQESITADSITSLFSEFKIRDKEDLQFAVYKEKHWKDFMEWSMGRPEPINQESVDKDEIKRRDKVWELFRSECVYLIDHVLVLKEIFQDGLRWLQCEGHLMHIEVAKLFANLDELCAVSTEFCRELFRNFSCSDGSTEFCGTRAVIAAFANFSSHVCPAYSRYCMNYAGALQYLQALKKQEEFLEFSKLCEQDKRCKRLKLGDLLVTPIQRITKYCLLLRDIRDCTKDDVEHTEIDATLRNVERSIDDLEGKVKWLSSFERMREIQQMLISCIWPADQERLDSSRVCAECRHSNDESTENSLLVSSQRSLIHEGPLRMIEHGKTHDVYVFLFDDMFLITRKRRKLVTRRSFTGYPSIQEKKYASLPRQKDGVFFVVCKPPIMLDQLHQAPVGQCQTAANDVQHTMVLLKTSRLGNVSEAYTFDCMTDSTKQTWVSHLQKSIRKWTETILKGMVPARSTSQNNNEERRKTY